MCGLYVCGFPAPVCAREVPEIPETGPCRGGRERPAPAPDYRFLQVVARPHVLALVPHRAPGGDVLAWGIPDGMG